MTNKPKNCISQFANNLSLKSKMFFINICMYFILLVLCTSLGYFFIIRSYNHELYLSLAESLSFSSQNLENSLETATNVSNMILADTTIQNHLAAIEEPDETANSLANDYNALYNNLQNYRNSNKDVISYISLYSTSVVVHTYRIDAEKVPLDIMENIQEKAYNAHGSNQLITDYSKNYGVFLAREIRESKFMSLRDLGVSVIALNMNQIIKDATYNTHNCSYILVDGDRIIYNSTNLSDENTLALSQNTNHSYQVTDVSGHSLFTVCNDISPYGWKYICVLPYDTIQSNLRFSIFLYTICTIIGAFAIIMISNYVINAMTKHFEILIQKMQAFSSSETLPLDNSIDYSNRKDEIGTLNQQFDSMATEIQQLVKDNYINELLIKDTELKALQAQINPHFLYNTLESINWRAKASGESQISSMIEALGCLLRASLNQKDNLFTISKELDIVQSYLTIQKFRFEEKLSYEMHTQEEYMDIVIPKLCIQPLVENAINYAVEESMDTCTIKIDISGDEHNVRICVKNDGSRFEENLMEKLENGTHEVHGFGIGLTNIDRRLQLMYGNDYGLTLYNEGDWAVALLIVPKTGEEHVTIDHC